MSKVAVIQHASVMLQRDDSLDDAVKFVAEAAANGAELVVFPEAYLPGYPAWIWRLRPGGDWGINESLYRRLIDNAVNIDAGDLVPVCNAAREHAVTIVIGMSERDSELSRSTLYNTVVTIGADGNILNRHRKLMPTNPERMVWGFGDASGLKVIDTPCGRSGTLLCWENYMPLTRYALYAQGIEVYIAPTYDSGEGWIGTLQHIAREARCWVIGCGVVLQPQDIPDDFPDREKIYPATEEWINPGDSVVIAPGGGIVAGPLHEEKAILYADVDSQTVAAERRALDIAGHYARPDIFTLHVNNKPQSPIEFDR